MRQAEGRKLVQSSKDGIKSTNQAISMILAKGLGARSPYVS